MSSDNAGDNGGSRNIREEVSPGGGPSWESLPERLANTARQIVDELRGGRPGMAMDLLDGMLAELDARRATLAELANAED